MNGDTSDIDRREGQDEPRAEEPTAEESSGPRRLRRSSSDRVILGVAGGFGRYFGIDPVLFRIGFVVSIFFGGLGTLAYLLLALFVPTDGEPDRAQRLGRRLQAMGFWRALGIVALAVVGAMVLFGLAGVGAFVVAIGWGVPIAIAIVVMGALLVLAAFRGGARWLIPPVVAVVAGAGVASAADLDFRGGIGERQYHPSTADSIPSNGYRLGIGRLVVDLRDLDWTPNSVIPLRIDLGTGQADVYVPERVCVKGSTHAGIGETVVTGERNDGVDVDHSVGGNSNASPRLDIDAEVDIGQLRIINSDTADVDTSRWGPRRFQEDSAPQRAAEARACATG